MVSSHEHNKIVLGGGWTMPCLTTPTKVARNGSARTRAPAVPVGGGRLGWPTSAKEDEPPPWLVFGAMIRTVAMTDGEAGVLPLSSALEQEGFGEAGAVQVTESFARHLMLAIDAWQVNGFGAVAREYLSRLSRERRVSRRIDDNGDLVTHSIGADKAERHDLLTALAAPSWFDPKLGGPRL